MNALDHHEIPSRFKPRELAEDIVYNPNEYSPIETWLATNYLNALALLDLREGTILLQQKHIEQLEASHE